MKSFDPSPRQWCMLIACSSWALFLFTLFVKDGPETALEAVCTTLLVVTLGALAGATFPGWD